LQREDRQVSRDDNGYSVKNRPLHFVRGFEDFLLSGFLAVFALVARMAHDVFHHAEIQRAEGKQVGRDAFEVQARGCEEE
jgi:hypothetical protein